MTKQRRSFTLSKELDEAIDFLATAKQMSLSEFLETRLRMNPEILKQIERFQNLPEDPIIEIERTGKISSDAPRTIMESPKNTKKLVA